METKTIQSLASEAIKFMTTKTRADGTEFVCTTDSRPDWVQDLCFEAHDAGAMLPDDHRYNMIQLALDIIADADDPHNAIYCVDPPPYSYDLTGWLDSARSRIGYLTTVLEENSGHILDGGHLLAMAWQTEFREVAEFIVSFLESRVEGCNDSI